MRELLMELELELGDVVRLTSGGHKMTLIGAELGADTRTVLDVVWAHGGFLIEDEVWAESVVKVNE